MKTEEKLNDVEQTIIERMVYMSASDDLIRNTAINVWKDVITTEIGPLEKWLSNEWRIIDSSTAVSTFDIGASTPKQTIHTTLVLERKIS